MGSLFRFYAGLAAGCVVVTSLGTTARAAPIFSQAPGTISGGYASDRSIDSDGHQVAEDVTLASADTARSVTWRGFFAGGNTPSVPLSFDLTFFGNAPGNLPNRSHVINSTTVSFTSAAQFADTGLDMSPYDVYEFRANLTPTALSSATPVWFSVLANTNNDGGDDFYWGVGSPANPAAARNDVSGNAAFTSNASGSFYFVLDNAVVPEPASAAMPGLVTAALALRRRREVRRGRSTARRRRIRSAAA